MTQQQRTTYGLIGYPLGHSFSARFFAEKFEREGILAQYCNFEMESVENLRHFIKARPDICGLNVTIPHKRAVIPHLDALSDEARAIGAVNVIKIERNGGQLLLTGHNTDAVGFRRSLEPLLRPEHQRALVLGTGGASRAIVHVLHALGITPQYVSRTRREGLLSYEDIDKDVMASHRLIVNCTPVGMHPHTDEAPALPYELLTPHHLLYDLIYNPLETRFLRIGREHGATTKNGLEMLELQALAAWEIWTT
ncbi:MAG: shikimate dehydrogenase [Alloprevotella sp.]|nr:shikimate dehydrogenase [Alloprevotella sp.]